MELNNKFSEFQNDDFDEGDFVLLAFIKSNPDRLIVRKFGKVDGVTILLMSECIRKDLTETIKKMKDAVHGDTIVTREVDVYENR